MSTRNYYYTVAQYPVWNKKYTHQTRRTLNERKRAATPASELARKASKKWIGYMFYHENNLNLLSITASLSFNFASLVSMSICPFPPSFFLSCNWSLFAGEYTMNILKYIISCEFAKPHSMMRMETYECLLECTFTKKKTIQYDWYLATNGIFKHSIYACMHAWILLNISNKRQIKNSISCAKWSVNLDFTCDEHQVFFKMANESKKKNTRLHCSQKENKIFDEKIRAKKSSR